MKIEIFHLIEGAQKAEGLAVIIDVFRAFSMECYLYAAGAREIRPVGGIDELFAWKKRDESCILVGERHGRRIDGCELGNSPSSIDPEKIRGRRIIHSTSAGTQGVVNAVHADEIITGSFVNAKGIVKYIRETTPEKVSLVCMGKEGLAPAGEDELCALYLQSLLTDSPMPDIDRRLQAMRTGAGSHFFNPETQEVYPEPDFYLCIARDRFDFAIRIEKDESGLVSRMLV